MPRRPSRNRYLQRTHFNCRCCDRKTWANELATAIRQHLCPDCYRAYLAQVKLQEAKEKGDT